MLPLGNKVSQVQVGWADAGRLSDGDGGYRYREQGTLKERWLRDVEGKELDKYGGNGKEMGLGAKEE